VAADDWRVQIDLHDDGLAQALRERLAATRLERELEDAFRTRVLVSGDGPHVFLYAGSRATVEEAQATAERIGAEHGWKLSTRIERWHPAAEAWKDPDVPLPADGDDRDAEHAELLARERAETIAQGYPSFEVRIECRSEADCAAFAARLEAEGLPVVHRGRLLLIGAADEDSAQALAARAHREAPDGAAVVAEGTAPAVLAGTPLAQFAVFGGLGG
jgi:hypothetical protein